MSSANQPSSPKDPNTPNKEEPRPISGCTVEAFLQFASSSLALETLVPLANASSRFVRSIRIQKPGLALAGFLDFVDPNRVHVLGKTEFAYLESLGNDADRSRAMERFLEKKPSVVLVSRGTHVPNYILFLAERLDVPFFRTSESTSTVIRISEHHLEELLSPKLSLHGALVDVDGIGVIITGRSGIGKSECALHLVSRGHRLVADDLVEIQKRGDVLIGKPSTLLRNLIEIRGLGVLNIAELYGVARTRERKRIELHVELRAWEELRTIDRALLDDQTHTILDIPLRSFSIPVQPGRNLAEIVEIAARNYLLQLRGHHAGEVLGRRVQRAIEQQDVRGSQITNSKQAAYEEDE